MENHFHGTGRILDVGGSSGGLFGAIKEKYSDIKYTCFDIDDEAIEYGKKLYPNADFINS